MSVPNQKIVFCDRWEGDIEPGMLYTVMVQTIADQAAKLLSGNAFKMYYYFQRNKKGFRLELSPVDVRQKLGIGKAAYDNAINELIDKGFLRRNGDDSNIYNFSVVGKPVDGSPVDGSPVDGKPVDGKPYYDVVGFPYDRSRVSGGRVVGLPHDRSRVSGGEINIVTTIDNNILSNKNNEYINIVDNDLNSTSSQENNAISIVGNNNTTSSQSTIISVAKKEEIDVGDCKYSFVDLVNAMRLIYRYDYDGAVERVKATFEPDQRHEEKWKALNFTSPEGLERAVERGRVKFADEAQPP